MPINNDHMDAKGVWRGCGFAFKGKGTAMPPEEFDEFWKIYPKKVAKGDARKAWIQTSKIRPPIADLLKAVYAARASKQWQKDDGDFIPHPATWLRQERWEDELEVDLSKLASPAGKVCAYCGKTSVGSVGGIWHCYDHSQNAMDGEKAKVVTLNSSGEVDMKPRRMLGVVAKPVAGRD